MFRSNLFLVRSIKLYMERIWGKGSWVPRAYDKKDAESQFDNMKMTKLPLPFTLCITEIPEQCGVMKRFLAICRYSFDHGS